MSKIKFYIFLFCFVTFKLVAQKKDFRVYDAMMFVDKPILYDIGLSKINLIYEDSLLSYNPKFPKIANERILNEKKLKRTFALIEEKYPICLDIESWTLDRGNMKKSIPKYVNVLKRFNTKYAKSNIGLYGVIPYADLNLYMNKVTYLKDNSRNWMQDWVFINNNIGTLAKNGSVFFPSCYTRFKDKKLWLSIFLAQIEQIKKIDPNQKIYAFIWPQYYSPGMWYNEQLVEKNFWEFQLETAYRYCDGVVIWSPPFKSIDRKPNYWIINADWWLVTKEFIIRKNIKSNFYENTK